MAAIYGAIIAPTFPLVEHKAIVIPRETVGNSSNVKALLATVNMEVQNLPMSENTMMTVLNSEKAKTQNNLIGSYWCKVLSKGTN